MEKKLKKIIDTLEDVKVKELKVFDFENSSPFYSYFVIATVNERQANAAVNYLKKALADDEIKHIEGKGGFLLTVVMLSFIYLLKS